MPLFRLSAVLLFAALASACASAPPGQTQTAPTEATVIDGSTGGVAATTPPAATDTAEAVPAQSQDLATAPASTAAPTAAEDDFAAIYGGASDAVADPTLPAAAVSPQAYDPWEKFNRKVHTFNNAVDRAVARPLARAYTNVVPRPVRLGVSNFFDNLGQPITAINQLLQGRPKEAGQTAARFLVNSTLGIGGIFDPASDLKLPRRSEDFGQTLGVWGWKKSRYVELPLFGPRTVRDTLGMSGDMPIGVVRQIEMDKVRIFLQGLNLVDTRAQLLSVDSLREGAVDDYALVRDSWMQRRAYQIEGSRKQDEDNKGLPDYLNEDDPDPTVPVDAMPMPELVPGG
ncbi:MAG TPA: VacJ family lipoprotein [Pseudoxanthomonas sp.]|jgi:phospholipid-binding lipoprotein MlaA|nr:VacJ family lipoprotein [Pseudoxanthomonas sp.]